VGAVGASTSASLSHASSTSAAAATLEFGGLPFSGMRAAPASETADRDGQSQPAGSLERAANAALFLDALNPCDHSHLLHSEENGIEKGGLLHQILEKDSELFPYATKAQVSWYSARERVSSSSSCSTVAGSSTFASPVSASLAPDQDCTMYTASQMTAATVQGPNEVIYPRRKSREDSRKACQVVVSPEILKEHFDMPLQDAAAKLGVCTSAIKKACRRFGIPKWPFRRLRGAANSVVQGHHAACESGPIGVKLEEC